MTSITKLVTWVSTPNVASKRAGVINAELLYELVSSTWPNQAAKAVAI